METLFPFAVTAADVPPIPGLCCLPEYVSEPQDQALAEAIGGLPWNTDWGRRRQPYGARYGMGPAAPPIPDLVRHPAATPGAHAAAESCPPGPAACAPGVAASGPRPWPFS